jgi:hypothetical protein
METTTGPKFLHLHDLGLSLQDSGKPSRTRQTLIRRGREFAESNGLRVFRVGTDYYVSAAEFDRLYRGEAA